MNTSINNFSKLGKSTIYTEFPLNIKLLHALDIGPNSFFKVCTRIKVTMFPRSILIAKV